MRVLSTSASVSKRWGHKSNWLRENLPLRIPALTLMVYMLFSSRSTMTPSKFRGSPRINWSDHCEYWHGLITGAG